MSRFPQVSKTLHFLKNVFIGVAVPLLITFWDSLKTLWVYVKTSPFVPFLLGMGMCFVLLSFYRCIMEVLNYNSFLSRKDDTRKKNRIDFLMDLAVHVYHHSKPLQIAATLAVAFVLTWLTAMFSNEDVWKWIFPALLAFFAKPAYETLKAQYHEITSSFWPSVRLYNSSSIGGGGGGAFYYSSSGNASNSSSNEAGYAFRAVFDALCQETFISDPNTRVFVPGTALDVTQNKMSNPKKKMALSPGRYKFVYRPSNNSPSNKKEQQKQFYYITVDVIYGNSFSDRASSGGAGGQGVKEAGRKKDEPTLLVFSTFNWTGDDSVIVDYIQQAVRKNEKRVEKRVSVMNVCSRHTEDCVVSARPLSTVILKAGLAERLLYLSRQFVAKRAEYTQRGIRHKTGFLFKGRPGTGKTTTALALASEMGAHLALISADWFTRNSTIPEFDFRDSSSFFSSSFSSFDENNNNDEQKFLDPTDQKEEKELFFERYDQPNTNSSSPLTIIVIEDVDSIFSDKKPQSSSSKRSVSVHDMNGAEVQAQHKKITATSKDDEKDKTNSSTFSSFQSVDLSESEKNDTQKEKEKESAQQQQNLLFSESFSPVSLSSRDSSDLADSFGQSSKSSSNDNSSHENSNESSVCGSPLPPINNKNENSFFTTFNSAPENNNNNNNNNTNHVKATEERKNGAAVRSSSAKKTLANITAALDGILSPENCIIIMTTNHYEDLPEALTRAGRINETFEFNNADEDQLKRLFSRFYGPPFSSSFCSSSFTKLQDRFVKSVEPDFYPPAFIEQHLLKYIDKPELAIQKIDTMKTEYMLNQLASIM